ncbi:MAG: metallophosphoesterase [Proteobacteria bacterium]|nr:metallophosphoesterase [Pseudomonadota bacterium]
MIICPSADDFEKSLGTVSHPMFLGIITIASALFAATVYFGIIRHVTRRKGWRIFWGIMVSLLASSFIWAMRGRRFIQPDSGSYDLVTVGFYVMMVAVVMMLLILLRDLAMWIWKGVKAWQNRRGRKLTPKNESDVQPSELQEEKSSEKMDEAKNALLSRRAFLLRGSSYGVLAGTAVLSPPAVWMAKCDRKIREVDIPFERWPEALDGLQIAHLSDIHVGNTITKKDIAAMVEETNALEPDIIVITGDIADGIPKFVAPLLEPMRQFRAKYGIYYVTGNHEHMWGGREWCEAVANLGITVLNNEHRIVTVGGTAFAVAGASDYNSTWRNKHWKSDPAAALADIPKEMFRLMLVHQPKSVDISFENGADLVLLGHTHGGQFWPACYIVDLYHKYARGLYRVGNKAAFVSCGTGYWGPPMRLGVPPEICLVRLRHAQTPQTQAEKA